MTAIYKYSGPKKNPRTLIVDEETALWCARMLIGEGGMSIDSDEASACLWALLNRWFLHPGRRYWPTFLGMMRRFSQPINPAWQRGGKLAKEYAGTKHCTKARLDRREEICAMNDFPWFIDEWIEEFKDGRLFPPDALAGIAKPRISNWASHKGLQNKYPHGITFQWDARKSRNWFFEDSSLIPGHVVVDMWGEG